MDKDPANVIPVDIMFDIQRMLKNGLTQEEILKQFNLFGSNSPLLAA